MGEKWHGGKGSKARPIGDRKKFADNWDAIFGKKDKAEDSDLKFMTAEKYIEGQTEEKINGK
jgi:hypothetical protein